MLSEFEQSVLEALVKEHRNIPIRDVLAMVACTKDKSKVNSALYKLQKEGLVVNRPLEENGARPQWSATEKGIALTLTRHIQHIFATLPPNEMEQLTRRQLRALLAKSLNEEVVEKNKKLIKTLVSEHTPRAV